MHTLSPVLTERIRQRRRYDRPGVGQVPRWDVADAVKEEHCSRPEFDRAGNRIYGAPGRLLLTRSLPPRLPSIETPARVGGGKGGGGGWWGGGSGSRVRAGVPQARLTYG